jgi:hypothetical protein
VVIDIIARTILRNAPGGALPACEPYSQPRSVAMRTA